ncbi:MAG: TlpA disulfide reductase family protein, partial [Nitrospiria bacterium]
MNAMGQWTKNAVFIFLFVLFATGSARGAGIGKPAADFTLPALNGEDIALTHYRGKVVLLNFWASWCAPCREELPELDRLHRHFQPKGFEVVGINIDKKRKNALKYAEKLDLSFQILLDPEAQVIERYPGRAMPISYLIGQDG